MKNNLGNKIVIIFAIIGLITVWTLVDDILEKWLGLSILGIFIVLIFILSIFAAIFDRVSK